MRQRTSNQLRCNCSRRPLLATYGVQEDGAAYVHLKVYKSRRVFGEAVFVGGKVTLKCRECLRWHTINIIGQVVPTLVPADMPSVIEEDPGTDHN